MSEIVPFVDLNLQYQAIKHEIDAAIIDVINDSAFVRGPYVERFENLFSKAMGRNYCVSCGNGTDSLYIAMVALGVKPGDEVIVPAHSWISTSETVTQAGATVVFCDTDRDTFTLDPSALESKITEKTVGIIPVHLYGQAADMDPIMQIANKNRLWVLEDCAQGHQATYKEKLVGTFGIAASFSFYPGKNLGAMGDAGAVVTDDPILAERMAKFARHGGLKKGVHEIEGINSRMDGLQAAILTVKLGHLASWNERRRHLAERYSVLLSSLPEVTVPLTAPGRKHVWHLYAIRHPQRDKLATHLAKEGVQTSINYPIALPFLPAYSRLGHIDSDFPNAHYNQSRIISIPIFPELTEKQILKVVSSIKSFVS